MRFVNYLGVLGLAAVAIGAPIEDAAKMKLSDTKCHPFKGKWRALKVKKAGERLKYNSLHIFETEDCSGSWTLEPIKCGGENCACSRITPYKSIQIVVS